MARIKESPIHRNEATLNQAHEESSRVLVSGRVRYAAVGRACSTVLCSNSSIYCVRLVESFARHLNLDFLLYLHPLWAFCLVV